MPKLTTFSETDSSSDEKLKIKRRCRTTLLKCDSSETSSGEEIISYSKKQLSKRHYHEADHRVSTTVDENILETTNNNNFDVARDMEIVDETNLLQRDQSMEIENDLSQLALNPEFVKEFYLKNFKNMPTFWIYA